MSSTRFREVPETPREISKKESHDGSRLVQRYLTKTQERVLDRERCLGCGICAAVCTKDAVTLSEAEIEEGRLVKRPEVEIDSKKCVMGGTCAVFCPSGALKVTTEGEEEPPVVAFEVIPTLRKTISVDSDRCELDCGLKCQEICPVDAITVETREDNGVTRITDVVVDTDVCIYCKQCEPACPYGLVKVERPFEGKTTIDPTKCPEGCLACIDACPSDALKKDDGGRPVLEQEFCILCSTCEQVCPEGAIEVKRTSVACSDVKSGAWFTALEKLTSPDTLSRELGIDAEHHRRELVKKMCASLL